MDRLDEYLLFMVHTFGRARKKPFLYAVVTGKRTGQAVTDTHLFRAKNYFGLAPFLKEEVFLLRLHGLEEAGFIRIDEAGVVPVTELDPSTYFIENEWNGFFMQDLPHHFFEHLLLAVQVVSNKHHQNRHYLPIVRNKKTQIWIKRWLNRHKNEHDLAEKLFLELKMWLERPDITYQDLYVGRFSGGDRIGETAMQICERLEVPLWNGYFEWLRGLHVLHAKKTDFPLLSEFMCADQALLTKSGLATYELFQSGQTFEQIVQRRRLKKSTIEDHFVEIQATFPHLTVPFRPDDAVLLKLSEHSFLTLKEMKEFMPDLSYFELRLAVVSEVKS
ncbi:MULTISPECIES: helix-turn-helix domain-containing protein [unclassified Listeria]|uniref:helix-turn-helix domain-containing protein n=1 Tax=unclassified Listeria TaxID=2642072 RepID=UPI000B58DB6A|nr:MULTISPECIES: helix-turn-helix domain-containing protein [unclassified Listeria]